MEKLQNKNTVVFEHDQSSWVPAPMGKNKLSINKKKYKNKRIIFLTRDPRDILVSSWHHLKYRENIYREGLTEFIREELVGIDKVIAFMNLWVNNKNIF